MDQREKGQASYIKDVKNKMKPKWLIAQVATHSLSGYYIFWIDKDINEEHHRI